MEHRNNALREIAIHNLAMCAMTVILHDRVYHIHVPSGDMKYESFWIRDAAMTAQSGLISTAELRDWIELICRFGQNGRHIRRLRHGLEIPPWSLADHINFDGGAVYFPGTSHSGLEQGDGRFGYYPPHDDPYYFIMILGQYARQAGQHVAGSFLHVPIDGYSPLERADKAFDNAHHIDPVTGLCVSAFPKHTVDWGFCDTVRKSGRLLFPSLLRMQAACLLADLHAASGQVEDEEAYRQLSDELRDSVQSLFCMESGWLRSATGAGHQPDVWGTAYALWLGALSGAVQQAAINVLLQSLGQGSIVSKGYARHVPVGDDAAEDRMWDSVVEGFPLHQYQNGGYWAAPIGWLAYVQALRSPDEGLDMLDAYAQDTQQHAADGAPYEWQSQDGRETSGHHYMVSAVLPWIAYQRIHHEFT